jgi:cytochrome c biogenesis protein CcdA
VVLSGAILASFVAGMVALFAPCCISVMLPAYFASSFATKRALIAMTSVFALGLGIIILPIALGAAALGSLITAHHFVVYLAGGLLMLTLGLYLLVGGELALPLPGRRPSRSRGPLAVLSLGAFSGVASSCCAPVLAGLVALAGASGSFGGALLLGVAYIFGMVSPLFVIALLWERFNWADSRLLRGWRVNFHAFGWRFSVHSTALASGLLLIAMGLVVIYVAFAGAAMSTSGWQLVLSADAQHYAHVLLQWLSGVPGWLTAAIILGGLVGLVWLGVRQARSQLNQHRLHTLSETQLSDEDRTVSVAAETMR